MSAGYLYAIEVSDEEVKIGRTNRQVEIRLKNHSNSKYKEGKYYVTEHRLVNSIRAENEACIALKKYLSRGKEYFSCDLETAVNAVKVAYEKHEKYLEPMKETVLLQVWLTEGISQFICKQANKDGRTRAGLVRRWLELIQAGKIKVDGVG